MLLCILAHTLSLQCLQKLPGPMAPGFLLEPPPPTSTHLLGQHTPPCPHTEPLLPDTEFFLCFCGMVKELRPPVCWMYHRDVPPPLSPPRRKGILPPQGTNPIKESGAPRVFMSEKSYLFLALSNSHLLQDDMCLIFRRAHLPLMNPRNYFPSFPK